MSGRGCAYGDNGYRHGLTSILFQFCALILAASMLLLAPMLGGGGARLPPLPPAGCAVRPRYRNSCSCSRPRSPVARPQLDAVTARPSPSLVRETGFVCVADWRPETGRAPYYRVRAPSGRARAPAHPPQVAHAPPRPTIDPRPTRTHVPRSSSHAPCCPLCISTAREPSI